MSWMASVSLLEFAERESVYSPTLFAESGTENETESLAFREILLVWILLMRPGAEREVSTLPRFSDEVLGDYEKKLWPVKEV